jgi:hypothetical protein
VLSPQPFYVPTLEDRNGKLIIKGKQVYAKFEKIRVIRGKGFPLTPLLVLSPTALLPPERIN